MKKIIFTTLLFFVVLCSWSQSGTIKVEEGKVVKGQFFFDKLYIFDNYLDGRIILNNGRHYTGPININTVTQSVRIISQEGDTIQIESENNVNLVSVGRVLFKKINNSYVQFLNTDGKRSLGLVRKMSIGSEIIAGAYGGTSETSSVSKLGALENKAESRFTILSKVANMEYFYNELLYILYKNKIVLATKRNFQKAFPGQKKLISNYLQENSVDFSKKESVISLFNYLIENK